MKRIFIFIICLLLISCKLSSVDKTLILSAPAFAQEESFIFWDLHLDCLIINLETKTTTKFKINTYMNREIYLGLVWPYSPCSAKILTEMNGTGNSYTTNFILNEKELQVVKLNITKKDDI